MKNKKECECYKHSARWVDGNWGRGGWECGGCGKINECSIKYIGEDMNLVKLENGKFSGVNPCCPLAPHPSKSKNEISRRLYK